MLVDVFFTNIVKGSNGAVPEIGSNLNWWIGGKDTGVRAKGDTPAIGENGNWWINGGDTGVRAKAVTVNLGQNGNWFIDGKDTGVKGKAPEVSIGHNGHWVIDGVDTSVPSHMDTYLDKNAAGNQVIKGNIVAEGVTDIRQFAYIASDPDITVPKDDFEILHIYEDSPRYICVLPRKEHTRVKLVLHKVPKLGDRYMVFMSTLAGCVITVPEGSTVKFWYGAGDDCAQFETSQRATAILHGYKNRWYVHTMGD